MVTDGKLMTSRTPEKKMIKISKSIDFRTSDLSPITSMIRSNINI